LIDLDSDLHDRLAGLSTGDDIRFSCEFVASDKDCVHEQSLFETNSVEHPAFAFRFSAVEAE